MNSLVVGRVFLSKSKLETIFFPGRPRCVLQTGSNDANINEPRFLPATAAAMIMAHQSDSPGQLHVSQLLHAQLSRLFHPFSQGSSRTADIQMSNNFCQDLLTLRDRQRHNLLCRKIRLQQVTTKRPSLNVPPGSPSQMCPFTTLTSHCISWHGKLQLCTDSSLWCWRKRKSNHFTTHVGSTYRGFFRCVLCFWSAVHRSVLCQSKQCIVMFLDRPWRLHHHANICSSSPNEVSQRFFYVCSKCFSPTRQNSSTQAGVCIRSEIQKKTVNDSMPLFWRKISTVVKNPGSTRSPKLRVLWGTREWHPLEWRSRSTVQLFPWNSAALAVRRTNSDSASSGPVKRLFSCNCNSSKRLSPVPKLRDTRLDSGQPRSLPQRQPTRFFSRSMKTIRGGLWLRAHYGPFQILLLDHVNIAQCADRGLQTLDLGLCCSARLEETDGLISAGLAQLLAHWLSVAPGLNLRILLVGRMSSGRLVALLLPPDRGWTKPSQYSLPHGVLDAVLKNPFAVPAHDPTWRKTTTVKQIGPPAPARWPWAKITGVGGHHILRRWNVISKGGAAGVSHDDQRAQTCTFERSSASTTTKIPREDPQRGKKIVAGEGKKSAKFWVCNGLGTDSSKLGWKWSISSKKFSSKSTFIKNHFHQKPFSSKTTFIKNHFHQKPLSSKTTFIKNHFHQKPLSSKTIFIKNHFHRKPLSSKTIFIKNHPKDLNPKRPEPWRPEDLNPKP